MQGEIPQPGETVVVRVTKVLNYGLFAELLEYDRLQGFVHISQVSSGWIKNIRNEVSENQIRAAQVLRVDPAKRQIDMSFNKVSSGAQRAKIEAYNQLKRSHKLFETFAKEKKLDFSKMWREVAEPLMEHYDSLYDALQTVAIDGDKAIKGVDEKWHAHLKELVEKNVSVPQRTVRGTLSASVPGPEGANALRDALVAARNAAGKAKVELHYAGSGKWSVSVTTHDYKQSEKAIEAVSEAASTEMRKRGGTAAFEAQD